MTSPRVLIVEDEPLSRDMLVLRLASRGFETEAVENGRACLDRLESGLPDLILMDISMPEMSGLEVTKLIRDRWSAETLPIIIVSAMVDSDDVIAGLEAGANDYVIKPVNLPVLLARMRVALTIKESVSRLMEAERQRVMLQSLGAACNRLAQPLTALVCTLENLTRHPPADCRQVTVSVNELLTWTKEAGDIINRLREVASLHSASYLERLAILDDRWRPKAKLTPQNTR